MPPPVSVIKAVLPLKVAMLLSPSGCGCVPDMGAVQIRRYRSPHAIAEVQSARIGIGHCATKVLPG